MKKSEEILDEKAIEKKKNYLHKYGLLSTFVNQDIFDIIIHYINGKNQIEESSFLKLLSEDNIFYNCKWRVLLIQNLLFFMMNPKFESTYIIIFVYSCTAKDDAGGVRYLRRSSRQIKTSMLSRILENILFINYGAVSRVH